MDTAGTWRAWITVLAVLLLPGGGAARAASGDLDFNRDIRPILSDHCYACHGPDESKVKGGLRLDRREDAFRALKSGRHALVAGDPAGSTLVERITSTDPDEVMPPPKGGKPLSAGQIDLLKRWVTAGAVWKEHWSYLAPERPAPPAVKDSRWARNALDRFVQARLEKEGLAPNPEADRATLVRRVTLDLTGLPPTIEEMDAALADKRPDAYERLVDRLLDSPRYGERMAQNWLDLARYADTSGYHFDGVRFMWLWRDWVIQSFNTNQPYDRFTVEQLAGDLLPNPTVPQRVATGFVRNNMTNDEGGADPDEYLNKYVVDRVNTLGAVWLGLTVGCTECHDHKYDPMTQREFYRLYAFFHNVPEKGLDRIRTDNPPPRLPVPTPEQAVKFVEADFAVKDAEKTLQDRSNELGETQEKWERETQERPPAPFSETGQRLRLDFEGSSGGSHWVGEGGPEYVAGRPGQALKFNGQGHLQMTNFAGLERTNAFSYGAWIRAEKNTGAVLCQMEPGASYHGWDLLLSDGRLEAHLVGQWPDDALKVRTREAIPLNRWVHVFVTYDGSGKAGGVAIHVDGRPRDVEVQKDQLKGSPANTAPLRIGARPEQFVFSGQIGEVRFFDRRLSGAEVRRLALEGYLPVILRSRGQRTDEERADLQRFYRESYASDYLRAETALAEARRRKEALYPQIPTTLIMEEMNPPRDTFVLVRGDFRNKGEPVTAGTPAFLPPLPEGMPTNRLGLANWLVSTNHPLTARVAVNRYWAMLFGTGLVKTANDFGSQGEWPSHPELLDWLAVQFRDGGPVVHRPGPGRRTETRRVTPWNVKELIRLMVTSATYRQSAAVTPARLEKDPYNRLLTRGPRLRLEAEFIRDNALAVSGLLNPQIGGASVKPYQPPGIWDGTDSRYDQDSGDKLYRRGLYVFWRRSAHYPSFATFDAPNREVCTFLRQRTQTPLQSLVLMNDPVYVEAARALAQRVLREEPTDPERRLVRAFRHVLGRVPQREEIDTLRRTYEGQRARFAADSAAAASLLKVGESKAPEGVSEAELAALTAVANVLLNLNEAITK